MDDPDVFIAAINQAGLEGQKLHDGAQDPAVKEQLKQNTSNAVERGVFGVPSFFIGDEMFFGKDRLAQVEAALAR